MRRAWVRVTAPELMCLLEAVGERALRGALDAIEVSGELLRIEDEAPGLRPSDTEAAPCPQCEEGIPHRHEAKPPRAPLEICVELADDIITALDAHDTHRMRHIRQCAERIRRLAK